MVCTWKEDVRTIFFYEVFSSVAFVGIGFWRKPLNELLHIKESNHGEILLSYKNLLQLNLN